MPKTEVILTKQIVGLGEESDHIKVAPGYARNYLIPQGLAIPVTGANKRRLEALRQRRAEREAHEYNTMSELGRSISKLTALIKVKTGDDGKLFGSVTTGMIVDQLTHDFDISLERKKIHLEHPIKTLGDHEVELRLHHDVHATLKVRVESLNPLPEPQVKEGRDSEKRGEKSEGESERRGPRGHRGPGRGRTYESKAGERKPGPEKPGAAQ
jgi:large subunit ribosomal protein L9